VHTVYAASIDPAGNAEVIRGATFKIDTTKPSTNVSAIKPIGTAHVSLQATADVFATDSGGKPVGQKLGTLSITCFDTPGVTIMLNATDATSGVASITYTATGAQTINPTSVNGSSASPSITAPGHTTLSYWSTDVAGNKEDAHSEKVIVASSDDDGGRTFACASPAPTFQVPPHGVLVASGTLTIFGHTFPFTNKTFHF
jgi:hypothetical protein